jgi:hypothetical protein
MPGDELGTLQSASTIRCHIGYGELAMSLPNSYLSNTVPVLVDILRDVPRIDFDESLSWAGVLDILVLADHSDLLVRMGPPRRARLNHRICSSSAVQRSCRIPLRRNRSHLQLRS